MLPVISLATPMAAQAADAVTITSPRPLPAAHDRARLFLGGSIDMGKAIRNIQAILNRNGFDAGQPDGLMGKKTVTAIRAFQRSNGLAEDGTISEALVRKLLEKNKVQGA